MSNNLEGPYIVRLEFSLWSWNHEDAMTALGKMSKNASEGIGPHAHLREASLIPNRVYHERRDS